MTDAQLTIIIAAIPGTIAALASWRQSRINGQKADVIHDLTNGSLSAVKVELKAANEKSEGLENKIEGLEAIVGQLIEKNGKDLTSEASFNSGRT